MEIIESNFLREVVDYETQESAHAAGILAATDALARSSMPVFMMSEDNKPELAVAYAAGWNTVWASEENNRRFN